MASKKTKLTKVEIDLIDKYMLQMQVGAITPAHVHHAIANTLPTHRVEQLYNYEPTSDDSLVYIQYMESFK